MAFPEVDSEFYPTPEEVHAQLLSDLRHGYARIGVRVNLKRNSELWLRTRAVARRISIAIRNGQLALRGVNPLTATGDQLRALCTLFGVEERGPQSSVGWLITVVNFSLSLTIPAGFRCTSPDGIVYQTTDAYTVSTANPRARVEAIDKGARTDKAAGTVLTWNSASIGFLGQKATVAAGGLDGGADADTEERLRERLLSRLRFPASGGNWAQVRNYAETASAAVDWAGVYPSVRGPASYDVVILGEPDDLVLNDDVVNLVAGAVEGQMPGHADLNVTAIVEEEVDVVLDVALPLPRHAGGTGGGWIDAEPWPSNAETGPNVWAKITAAGAATITVNSTSDDVPVAGKRIAIWDYADLTMRQFAIVNVSGVSGAYVLTLDVLSSSLSLAFVEVGMYVSAAAVQLQAYADAFIAAMRALGPGEKTDNPDILVFGRRRPSPEVERPWALSTRLLSSLEATYPEISDLAFAARLETGTNTTRTTPSIPPTTANAPRKLSLKHLSFRRITP